MSSFSRSFSSFPACLQLTWKAMISDSMLRTKAQDVHVHKSLHSLLESLLDMFRDLVLKFESSWLAFNNHVSGFARSSDFTC